MRIGMWMCCLVSYAWLLCCCLGSSIKPVERGTIRADDLVIVAHIKEDVGMIEGRGCTDALKFARVDLDFVFTTVIGNFKHWSNLPNDA